MVGHGEATVCVIINEVCDAIVTALWEDSVMRFFPKSPQNFEDAMIAMDTEWQFQYAFCAIDGSHIPIKCPPGGAEAMKEYYNFKGFYSTVLMALVDAKYRFIWASIGAPGNTHDSLYFKSSDLYHDICQGEIIPATIQKLDQVEVPPMILGDSAFELKTWLTKPYGDAIPSPEKRYFNYRLIRARMVTEGAFGKLKSRFRILHRKFESQKETVKLMGLACIVLHNICLDRGDPVPRQYDLTLDVASNKRRDPKTVRDLLDLIRADTNFLTRGKAAAENVRNAIKDSFWAEKNGNVEHDNEE
ncbi:uncharacterized protein [Clytia hemisphaerica]|uniref:uncharacterized protein n=1 Tax=Clytia hemisphaerica TaxID=252671 RepID=UPI0034D5D21D